MSEREKELLDRIKILEEENLTLEELIEEIVDKKIKEVYKNLERHS
ncbi:hypothetical protein PMW03_02010 [Clostridium paraputrificum]|nr:hypothetical protein [Clostridium paraputrificum]MDB2108914.1 hypothetical protein [Clostridium paraputrificum]DAU71241.1 MAG TPA: hypothetical protein [Caudoviricetes sp.]